MKVLRVLVLLAAVSCLGCLRVEQTLNLRPDASGTLEIKYSVPDETTKRVEAMLKLAQELAGAVGDETIVPSDDAFLQMLFDPTEKGIRETIESYADLGITLDELEVKERGARREVKFTIRFRDISEVAKADFFENYGFSLVKSSAGNYVMFNQPITREPLDKTWDITDTAVLKMLTPLLSGFHFGITVQTPGRILKTNAREKTPLMAEWTYTFDEDPYALAKLQRDQMKIVFEGQGLHLPEIRQLPTEMPKTATPSGNE